jgi:hypothetical protein
MFNFIGTYFAFAVAVASCDMDCNSKRHALPFPSTTTGYSAASCGLDRMPGTDSINLMTTADDHGDSGFLLSVVLT